MKKLIYVILGALAALGAILGLRRKPKVEPRDNEDAKDFIKDWADQARDKAHDDRDDKRRDVDDDKRDQLLDRLRAIKRRNSKRGGS